MSLTPILIRPSRRDRVLAVIDRVRHPRLTHELSRATQGFAADGVVRTYANDPAGRRREIAEGPILWHRGYRPPTRLTHNAIWNTGGHAVTVAYNRERLPAVMGPREREVAERLGLLRR